VATVTGQAMVPNPVMEPTSEAMRMVAVRVAALAMTMTVFFSWPRWPGHHHVSSPT
jgi:hypothetical protein